MISDPLQLSVVKDIAAVIAVAIASLSLAVAAYNTGITRRTNRAQFWLDLRRMFSEHETIHRRLRPQGDWAAAKSGPANAEEWAAVEAYMGLFEICEDLIADKLIDANTFKKGYAYRIENIVANDLIRHQKLVINAKYWERFLDLAARMGIAVSQ
jgi:hypothetical protein